VYSPTLPQSIPLEELGWANATYLGSGTSFWDPMMVWGTTVDVEPLETFLAEERRHKGLIFSPAHVLVRAVVESLKQHAKLNRRVVGRRVYRYDGVNVLVPMLQTRSGEADTVYLRRADRMSLSDIAQRFWSEARRNALEVAAARRREQNPARQFVDALKRRMRLNWIHKMSWLGFAVANRFRIPTIWKWQQEINGADAFVNYLGFPGAPPMHCFKPSCLPMSSYSVGVTMGPSERRPAVVENAVVIRSEAPLFIRADHRMVNAYEAAEFINTLRAHLLNPWALVENDPVPDTVDASAGRLMTVPVSISRSVE
jgi:hypothetical protein